MRRKHVYGPVPSRRFGLSLGVDVVPHKVCTLDCIYCQVGPTTRRTLERECFVPSAEVIEDVRQALDMGPKPGVITFAGSGEPTLYSELGVVAKALKEFTNVPLLLITNGTLLFREDVATDAMWFDRVAPSLDAADMASFKAINQPHPDLDLTTVIEGLKRFAARFTGQLDLELFFLEGVNDSPEAVAALADAVRAIHPSRVDLNTAVRPTPHRTVSKATPEFLAGLEQRFSVPARSVFAAPAAEPGNPQVVNDAQVEQLILSTLQRRPCTQEDLTLALPVAAPVIAQKLESMLAAKSLVREERDGRVYFVCTVD